MEVTRAEAEQWAPWFQALGDPTRILILHLLVTADETLTVGDIVDRLDVGQSTVSHHLAKLAEHHFVTVERVGTTSRWRINRRCLDAFPTAAEIVMNCVPTDFTVAVERAP
ncbi:MAG TPA: metalloregulator ArsR/SmtB family transcription factor [Acidimicrobiia bacterium]|jgi:DNA-binding transcriptional ArsR family regulator